MPPALRQLWPQGWRRDVRTLGLLLAGFFAYLAIVDLQTLNLQLNAVFDRPPPGLPPGYPFHFPTSARVIATAGVLFGLTTIVVACGGVALMAGVRWASRLTASGLVAGVACQLTALATIEHSGSGAPILGLLASLVGLVLLLLLVTEWVPVWHRATTEGKEEEEEEEEGEDDQGYEDE